MNATLRRLFFATASLVVLSGCGRGAPRVSPPAIDPARAGRAAIDEYDTNHDGVLSGGELNACPGLKAAAKKYSNDGEKITASDIAARIRQWQASPVCMTPMSVKFALDGKDLVGASITAEPEKFLGPDIPAATGVTNSKGIAWLHVDRSRPGAFFGIYKVRVSKVVDGKETIPERYNTKTELGLEKAPDTPRLIGVTFDLKSR